MSYSRSKEVFAGVSVDGAVGVSLIVEAQRELEKQNIQARLVSMPCWELFDAQTEEYRRSVFPPVVVNGWPWKRGQRRDGTATSATLAT